jgi:hypothetical protein
VDNLLIIPGFSSTTVALVAMFALATPQSANAKVLLECNGASQHQCQGKFGCIAGSSGCDYCPFGAACPNANTCFSPERFTVEIDEKNGEIGGAKYNVVTSSDAYSLTPVDPNALNRGHADDQLSIGRLNGRYMWWPEHIATPFRTGWHYEDGEPTTLNPQLGCHAVKTLF